MKIQGKVVLIISHESWGDMLMSKHHYAITLAQNGNQVFFINHPDRKRTLGRGSIQIASTNIPNLSVIHHRFLYPFFLKFKAAPLYYVFTFLHIKRILRKIKLSPDIVWSFDTSNTLPLQYFPNKSLKVFMPVDGPFWHEDELKSSNTADIIISVTQEILSRYNGMGKPLFMINHGVAAEFFMNHSENMPNGHIRIGYSGSLLRDDLGTDALLAIIRKHANITFEFWGEYDSGRSNIHLPQNIPGRIIEFIDNLKLLPNVILHGSVSPLSLANGLNRMDAFIVCYNRDCMNSHKLLEYLAIGKVIISTPVSYYLNSGLVEMTESIEADAYMTKFENVVANLHLHNSKQSCEKRRAYALTHSYESNVIKIGGFIEQVVHEHA